MQVWPCSKCTAPPGIVGHAPSSTNLPVCSGAQGPVAFGLDDPSRQPCPSEHRWLEGWRPPGILGIALHDHGSALRVSVASAGPGGGETPCLTRPACAASAAQHDRPVCFIAYTIKGFGLPFQGHKDNHAGLMTVAQMDAWRVEMGIRPGFEWEPLEGLNVEPQAYAAALKEVPFVQEDRRRRSALTIAVPEESPPSSTSSAAFCAGASSTCSAMAKT